MASVRFSQNLRADIINKARNTFNKGLTDLREAIPIKALIDAYRREFSRELRLAGMVPDKYIKDDSNTTLLEISDMIMNAEGLPEEHTISVGTIRWDSSNRLLVPAGGLKVCLYMQPGDSPMTDSIREEAKAYFEAQTSFQKKVDTVTALVTHNGTLNKALEAWPLLEQFVPAYAMNKLRSDAPKRATAEPKEKPKIDKSVLNEMTVGIMTSNITNDW